MNSKQYIPAMVNPFDCDYYGKEFPHNQHMGEHRFNQNEGKTFNEFRHSQPANMNSEQFGPYEANSYPCSVYGFSFPQNQHSKEHRHINSNGTTVGEQRNSLPINMAAEPYTPGVLNYSASDVSGINYTQQEHNLMHNEILPLGSDNCDKRFTKKEKHARERTFICEVCGRGFSEMSNLTIHSRIHSGERPFPCEVCNKKFASREGLRSHLVVHSQERPFPCDLCDKKFARKQQMQHHRLIHTGERPHVCELCLKAFPIKKSLKIHMRSHSEERPYDCDQCGKKFKSKNELKRHFLYHAKEKPFLCELCPMRFHAPHNLKLHQRVHTGVKPYHCQLCPIKFSNKNSYLKHVRSHNEQSDSHTSDVNHDTTAADENTKNLQRSTKTKEPIMCFTCRVEFTEQCELEKHQLYHKREKPFACFICGLKFFRSPNLKLHLGFVHSSRFIQKHSQGKSSLRSELYSCQLCNKKFLSQTNLQNHILNHLHQPNSSEKKFPNKQGEFACNQCGKRFTRRKNLRAHVLIHSTKKKPHKCVVCSKRFINKYLLRRHTQVHSTENPYACPVCQNKFKRKDYLVSHFRRTHNEQSNLQTVDMSSEQDTNDKSSLSKTLLQSNILNHLHQHNTSEKKIPNRQSEFYCNVCRKKFTYWKDLQSHILIHSLGKKIHKCVVCPKRFANRSLLRRHTRVHTSEKPYVCHLCHNRYKRRDSLVKHLRRHHRTEQSVLHMVEMSSDQHASDEEDITLAVLKERIFKAKKKY